jgi:phospholipase D1/2
MSFLIDAADYYRAFAAAAERAEKQIVITAWDIDGRARLRPDHSPESLRSFFFRLLEEKPDLHIYVLNWKFFVTYAGDRELLPSFDAPWRQHPRLHFEWDSSHPVGACHHQKIVVIDDTLAFVGGLDFTHERWDTPRHDPTDPLRLNDDGEPYKPFHDTTVMVEGPIARDLGELVRRRWRRCVPGSGGPYGSADSDSVESCWPSSTPIDLRDISLGIARTEPPWDHHPPIVEIETLHRDMIQAAERFVYIESQYFTAERVLEAIRERLSRPDSPEFIVVLPKGCTGWLEEISLGILRSRGIAQLRKADRRGRLHIFYPYVSGLSYDQYIKVHSKLMIVDDRALAQGSANLCNRSMAVDTECDLALEALPESGASQAIKHFRERLLAEHLGVSPSDVSHTFEQHGSLSATVGALNRKARRLIAFNGEVSSVAETLQIGLKVFDPTRPLL